MTGTFIYRCSICLSGRDGDHKLNANDRLMLKFKIRALKRWRYISTRLLIYHTAFFFRMTRSNYKSFLRRFEFTYDNFKNEYIYRRFAFAELGTSSKSYQTLKATGIASKEDRTRARREHGYTIFCTLFFTWTTHIAKAPFHSSADVSNLHEKKGSRALLLSIMHIVTDELFEIMFY